MPPHINPIYVKQGEVVEIHWRLNDGTLYTQQVTCPPNAVLAVRTKPKLV